MHLTIRCKRKKQKHCKMQKGKRKPVAFAEIKREIFIYIRVKCRPVKKKKRHCSEMSLAQSVIFQEQILVHVFLFACLFCFSNASLELLCHSRKGVLISSVDTLLCPCIL